MKIAIQNQRGSLSLRTCDSSPLDVTAAPDVDVGTVYAGFGGSGMKPSAKHLAAMHTLRDTGLLSPGAVVEIDRILRKFGGAAATKTSSMGITSTDTETARAAVAEVRANIDNNRAIAKARDAYWKERLARDRADILGRSS
jgi:hypothetical protein